MFDIPRDLIQDFARSAGSVFVGGGLRLAPEVPGWPELEKQLRSKIPDCPESADLAEVADYFEHEFDRPALIRELCWIFSPEKLEPGDIHRLVVSVPKVKRIFTTRLDDLLERAAEVRGAYRKVPNLKIGRLSPDLLNIIKLGGDYYDNGSFVATQTDHEDYPTRFPEAIDLVRDETQRKTVLLCGFGFNDMDLRTFFPKRIEPDNEHKWYILQPNPTKAVVRSLEGRGLRVLTLPAGHDSDGIVNATSEWLRQFTQAVTDLLSDPEADIPRPAPISFAVPPAGSRKLLGRKREVQSVLEAIGDSRWRGVHIAGPSGIGKTSLAAAVGRSLNSNSEYEKVIWVSANAPGQTRSLRYIVDAVLAVLSPLRIPKEHGECLAAAARLLSATRAVLTVDNLESITDPELMPWLRKLPTTTKLLTTSTRSIPNELHPVFPVELAGLDSVDAVELARLEARALGLIDLDSTEFRELVESAEGNPQIIKLALGQVKGGLSVTQVSRRIRTGENTFEVAKWAWSGLSEPARQVLLSAAVFTGPARYDALREVTGLPDADMDNAVNELRNSRLLELDYRSSRFLTHSGTIKYASDMLMSDAPLFSKYKDECIRYLLGLVRKNIEREVPALRYWNALVSDNMCNIDPDWPCIQQALQWVTEDNRQEDLVEFVMLLIHYLNSRFLNAERVALVERALDIVHRTARYEDEALLRIDALGWTYLEENRPEDAEREIRRGLEIVNKHETEQQQDLVNLAHAWLARSYAERELPAEANRFLSGGLLVRCSPWIAFRVYMAAGDVAMKQKKFAEALRYYERCNEEAHSYGGEGHGYQIRPRMGIACVALNRLDEAKAHFDRLRQYGHFSICRAYADYGLALVEARRGNLEQARTLAKPVQRLMQKTNSGLLLNLIGDLLERPADSDKKPDLKQTPDILPSVPIDVSRTVDTPTLRRKVFISYNRKDTAFLEELLIHLRTLEREGHIVKWSDTEIKAGSDWLGEIQQNLSETKVAVLLVSAEFLDSDFIRQHELGPILREADQGGVRIIWFPVRAFLHKVSPLAKYQSVIAPERTLAEMNDADRAKAWVRICEAIVNAVETSEKIG